MAADSLVVTMQVSNYNGFQVSCFGEKDGWIDLSVTGGEPPYNYEWSNGSNQQDLTDLAVGYYRVDVIDNGGKMVTKEVTLDQPLAMKLDVDVYEYSNGYNISCYQCSNGNASVVVLGGAPPFTITWSDGPSGATRYNLAAKDYKITAADANGCAGTSVTIYLRGPDRSDWSMSGNPGTTPGPQYIGTPDNKDVVFKSNAQERLRLKSDGTILLPDTALGVGMLYRDADGSLKVGGGPSFPVYPSSPCAMSLNFSPFWKSTGNDFGALCSTAPRPVLGTLNNEDLSFITHGIERVRLNTAGQLGIGTIWPDASLHVQGNLLVRDGTHGDIVTSSTATTGPVLWARNGQAAWGLSIDPDGKGHILGDWNDPHPVMTFAYNKVGIGTEDMPNDDYSLFVGKGILTEKVKVALQTSDEWSDHVFQPGYGLMPLRDVDAFIKEHGHLPGVPSAAQMVDQGLDVVKTDAMLLGKVEELTLHLIHMEKRMDRLEKENTKLRKLLNKN